MTLCDVVTFQAVQGLEPVEDFGTGLQNAAGHGASGTHVGQDQQVRLVCSRRQEGLCQDTAASSHCMVMLCVML